MRAAQQPRPDKPIFLTLKGDLTLALGEETLPREQLQMRLDAQTNNDHEQRVFVRADKSVAYGELMTVMNLLRDAGYFKVALVGLEDAATSDAKAPAPQ